MMKMVLFPSINFIQSLTGSYVEDVHRLFESSLKSEEEPCCSRNINPVIERKVYCSICNNPFSVSTIEEHADLCLENKSKLFFERQLKSSDDKKSVSMIDEKTEMRGHLDQTKLVPAIYKKCEMNEENELALNVRRGFCFKDFLKTFQKSWNIKKMRKKYSITFIGASGIDTGGVSREFYLGFVGSFCFFHFSFILKVVYSRPKFQV